MFVTPPQKKKLQNLVKNCDLNEFIQSFHFNEAVKSLKNGNAKGSTSAALLINCQKKCKKNF